MVAHWMVWRLMRAQRPLAVEVSEHPWGLLRLTALQPPPPSIQPPTPPCQCPSRCPHHSLRSTVVSSLHLASDFTITCSPRPAPHKPRTPKPLLHERWLGRPVCGGVKVPGAQGPRVSFPGPTKLESIEPLQTANGHAVGVRRSCASWRPGRDVTTSSKLSSRRALEYNSR